MRLRTLRGRLMAGAGGLALLALAADGGATLAGRARLRAALRDFPDVTVGSMALDPLRGRLTLRHAAFSRGRLRLTADAVDAPLDAGAAILVSPAWAASSTTSADSVRVEDGGTVLTIPHVELRGASLGALLAALGRGEAAQGSAALDALTTVAFESLAAPEVSIAHAGGEGEPDGRLTLRDIAVGGVGEGRIADLTVGSLAFTETRAGRTKSVLDVGKTEAHAIDVGLAATIATKAREGGAGELRPVLGSLAIADIAITPDTGGSLGLGSFEVAGLNGRPSTLAPRRVAEITNKPDAERSPEERTQIIDWVRDAVGCVVLDRLDLRKFAFAQKSGPDPSRFDLATFSVHGFAGLKIETIALDNVALKSPEVTLQIGHYGTEGLDETALLGLLVAKSGRGGSPSQEQLGRMSPRFTSAALTDVTIAAAVKDGNGNVDQGRTVAIAMPALEIKVNRAGSDVASDASAHFRMVYDIVSPAPGSPLEQAKENGFAHFDITSDYGLTFDEPKGVLRIDHLTVAAKDLASASLGVTVSGVTSALLEGDTHAIAEAPQALRFEAAEASLANDGVAEKALPLLAEASKVSVADLKTGLKRQAEAMVEQGLGTGSVAHDVAAAADTFIDDPRTFSLKVTAPNGLDVAAFNETKSADDFLKLVEVTVKANQ